MHRVIAARIETFDRVAKRLTVTLSAKWHGVETQFNAVMAQGVLPIGKEPIYLLEDSAFDDSDVVTAILQEIGNPKCSIAAPEALAAMGASAAKKIPKGTDPDSPIAEVLWQANKLASKVLRSAKDVEAIVGFAKTANKYDLNPSQIDAVRSCAKNQLTIVWGPPGTGKTDTLVAFLHSVIRQKKARKILIAGPNYRTAEELSGRLVKNLEADASAACDYDLLRRDAAAGPADSDAGRGGGSGACGVRSEDGGARADSRATRRFAEVPGVFAGGDLFAG
jgi:hypothetical protein